MTAPCHHIVRTSQAFRRLAKVHHPDKGGDAVAFGRIQAAFQVLSDPQKRTVYDTWARELQFRYVRGIAAKVWLLAQSTCNMSHISDKPQFTQPWHVPHDDIGCDAADGCAACATKQSFATGLLRLAEH